MEKKKIPQKLEAYQLENIQELEYPTDVVAVVVSPKMNRDDIAAITKQIMLLQATGIPYIAIQTHANQPGSENLCNRFNIDPMYYFQLENCVLDEETEFQSFAILDALIGIAVEHRSTKKHPNAASFYYKKFRSGLPHYLDLLVESRNWFRGYGHAVFSILVITVAYFVLFACRM